MWLPNRVLRPIVKHMSLLLVLTLPLLAWPVQAHEEAVPPRSAALLQSTMVDMHNAERARLGLQRLSWDDGLAKDAARWARRMAETGQFEHAPVEHRRKSQGENLWMGTQGGYSYSDMAAMWLDEKAMARSGRFPDVSTTGDWRDVGHYTQMIWPKTAALGCALASGGDNEYLVCRYAPAGNRTGDIIVIK